MSSVKEVEDGISAVGNRSPDEVRFGALVVMVAIALVVVFGLFSLFVAVSESIGGP